MTTETSTAASLDGIRADRRLLDDLFAEKLITPEQRAYAIDLIYPTRNWGLWASRLFLALGVSLILSGIVYFFAFNWAKIPPAVKLASIQIALLGCLGGTFYYGLQKPAGKTLLLSAFVLVGVFMAVFGQIYQTGADAYNLFMMWALLALPWVLIAEFAPLWALWIGVSNVFFITFWAQVLTPSHDTEMLLYACLAMFNGFFLLLREILVADKFDWLSEGWTRHILIVPILGCLLFTTVTFIFDSNYRTEITIAIAVLSAVMHCVFLYVYRYVLPSIMALVLTTLSVAIIAESTLLRILTETFTHNDSSLFLLMGIITLAIFATIVILLRAVATEMEARNV